MKCPHCGHLLAGALLVNDTVLHCRHCHAAVQTQHSTDFQGIMKNRQGDCPFCGQFNEDFRCVKGLFVCDQCGCSFTGNDEVDRNSELRETDRQVISSVDCPDCGMAICHFMMVRPGHCTCPWCSSVVELPAPIDVPRIALIGSGTCPFCLTEIFNFEQQEDIARCPRCCSIFKISLSRMVAFKVLTSMIKDPRVDTLRKQEAEIANMGPGYDQVVAMQRHLQSIWSGENVQDAGDEDAEGEDDELSLRSKIERAYKKLSSALGSARSYDELRIALSVEFLDLYLKKMRLIRLLDTQADVSEEEKAIWQRLFEWVTRVTNSSHEHLAALFSYCKPLAEEAYSKGIEDASAIAYSLLQAATLIQKGGREPLDVTGLSKPTCLKCDQSSYARVYMLVRSDSPAARDIQHINTFTCVFCGTSFSMSFSVAYCHMTDRRVICFIGKLDLLPYQQTGKIPSLDEHIKPFIQEQQFALETTDDFSKFQQLIKSRGEKKKRSPILPLGRKILSQSSGSLRVLGARNFREGEYEAAVRCYTIAALFELRSPDIYEGLAAAYSALGRYDEALNALEKVRSLNSEEAIYKRVAEYAQSSTSSPEEIQENIGKTSSEETESLWKMAHLIFGDNEERKSQVTRDYARQVLGLSMEKEIEALARELFVNEAERYLEKYPGDQEICATLAITYHELRKKYETVRAHLKTIAIQPEKSQASHMARYQLNMTDILEYLQELQKQHVLPLI